jgi:hypothetical protein
LDRSMKSSSRLSAAEWEALLARIQSPSKELEAHLARANSNLIDALSGLEELEKLTEHHLAPPAPAVPPAPAQASSAAPASAQPAQGFQPSAAGQTVSAQPQTTPVQYQTSREEYAPALNQSALVEALLQYQRKKSIRNSKPAASAQSRSQSASQAADEIHSTPAFARADFSPMRIPEIQAEPKNAPIGRAATPSVRLPVLRLKSESSSSGNSHDDEQN